MPTNKPRHGSNPLNRYRRFMTHLSLCAVSDWLRRLAAAPARPARRRTHGNWAVYEQLSVVSQDENVSSAGLTEQVSVPAPASSRLRPSQSSRLSLPSPPRSVSSP